MRGSPGSGEGVPHPGSRQLSVRQPQARTSPEASSTASEMKARAPAPPSSGWFLMSRKAQPPPKYRASNVNCASAELFGCGSTEIRRLLMPLVFGEQ